MPDPTQAADAVATAGKAGGVVILMLTAARLLVSGARRLGASEALSDAEGRLREALMKEREEERHRAAEVESSLRARIEDLEAALRRADLESVAWQQRFVVIEAERDSLQREVEALRGAWDPERTLPPGLG